MDVVDLTDKRTQNDLSVACANEMLGKLTEVGLAESVVLCAWLPWLTAQMTVRLGKDGALAQLALMTALVEGDGRETCKDGRVQ